MYPGLHPTQDKVKFSKLSMIIHAKKFVNHSTSVLQNVTITMERTAI